jgi:hypothetical protein
MLVASSLVEDEVTRLCGQRYERQPHRTHTRYGHQRGTATLAGQKIAIARPRVRRTDGGGEVALETYARLQSPEAMPQAVLRRTARGFASWPSPARSTSTRACSNRVRGSEFGSLAQSSAAGGRSPRERLGREGHIHREVAEVVARAERVQGRLGPSGVSIPVAHAGGPGIPWHRADVRRPATPLHPSRERGDRRKSGAGTSCRYGPRGAAHKRSLPLLRDVDVPHFRLSVGVAAVGAARSFNSARASL